MSPFAIPFPLGVMNVTAMALLTVLIFAGKALPLGRRLSRIVGITLIAFGMVAILVPAAFPIATGTL